jgi:predicted phage terminase large subunit-like protein
LVELLIPKTKAQAEIFAKQVDAELRRRDLREFVKAAWHLIEPITPLKWSWHFDAICQHLQAVTEGKISRLLINVPPGSGKSSLISVLWPVWEMIRRPSEKWLFFSHREDLADRDSIRRRLVITSSWFQDQWPIELRPDQNQKGMYTNMAGGSHLSSGTSAVTGFRGSRLILDDPNSTTEMSSELQRTSLLNWINLQWSTRGNDGHVKVVIQQRSHEADVTGHLLTQSKIPGGDSWCHLRISMEYDPDTRCTTEIGWSDPRTEKGELMDPSRFTRDPAEKNKTNVVAEKIRLGSYGWSGQYQQEPTPFGGGIFKRAWLRSYDRDKEWIEIADGRKFNLWEQWRFATVDLAISTKDLVKTDPDYTVIAVWCVFQDHPHGPNIFLLDVIRERMEGPDIEKKIEAVAETWKLPMVLVETIGYQLSTAQSLIRRGVPVREASTKLDAAYRIEKDKTSRAIAATPLMENMRFWVPRYATWKADWEAEHMIFPNGSHDDQVDTTSMAVGLTQKYGSGAMNWDSLNKTDQASQERTQDDEVNRGEVVTHQNVYGADTHNNPLSGFSFPKP